MVLKNSKADLWVRNVQLSLFSLVPALLPTLYHHHHSPSSPTRGDAAGGFFAQLFAHFGLWAWATVAVQVFGGLVTAVVIKYSDNILKGFATSLSIILSFLASVALFDFRLTSSFLIGSSVVLAATWMYNQPAGSEPQLLVSVVNGATAGMGKQRAWPGAGAEGVILGEGESVLGLGMGMGMDKKAMSRVPSPSPTGSPTGQHQHQPGDLTPFGHSLAGYGHPQQQQNQSLAGYADAGNGNGGNGGWMEMLDTPRYLSAPYGSPYNSRTPSPAPAPAPVPPSPSHSVGSAPPGLTRFGSSGGLGSPGTGVWMGGGERRE